MYIYIYIIILYIIYTWYNMINWRTTTKFSKGYRTDTEKWNVTLWQSHMVGTLASQVPRCTKIHPKGWGQNQKSHKLTRRSSNPAEHVYQEQKHFHKWPTLNISRKKKGLKRLFLSGKGHEFLWTWSNMNPRKQLSQQINKQQINLYKSQVMWVKQCHKPSPSHHHVYRWYN